MQVFVYEYTGDYCHGGYVCIAETEERAKEILIKEDEDCKKDFNKNSNIKLELKYVIPTTINEEMILLNSYDCC